MRRPHHPIAPPSRTAVSLLGSTLLHALGIGGAFLLAARGFAVAGWQQQRQASRPATISLDAEPAVIAAPPLLPPAVTSEGVVDDPVVDAAPVEEPFRPIDDAVAAEPAVAPHQRTVAWLANVVRRESAIAAAPPVTESLTKDTQASPSVEGATVQPSPSSAHNPAPYYPFVAWRRGIEGRVVVELDIDRTGVVTAARIATSSGNASLDESARTTLAKWRFTPASNGLGPLACTLRQAVVFRILDKQVVVGAAP